LLLAGKREAAKKAVVERLKVERAGCRSWGGVSRVEMRVRKPSELQLVALPPLKE
jgi:hypothetical protein